MTTRQELERMVEEKARDGAIEYCLKDEYPTGNSGFIAGFKSGAAFVMDKLMLELNAANERIKELEAEINSLQCECDSGTQCQACFLKEALTPPERGEE